MNPYSKKSIDGRFTLMSQDTRPIIFGNTVNPRVKIVAKKVEDTVEKKVEPVVQVVELKGVKFMEIKGDPGTDGAKGDKGDTPTDAHLVNLIKPLIPKPIKGDDGADYILSEKDKKDIARSIKVPVVEKVIERTEIVRETPIVKEVAIPESREETRDKLESLTKGNKLTIYAIEDLAEIIEELSKKTKTSDRGGNIRGSIYGGVPVQVRFIDDETPVNSGDNLSFTISKTPATGSFKLYRGGSRQRVGQDYTLSGRTFTLISALESGEILLCDFRH